jgi:hypothetical protein
MRTHTWLCLLVTLVVAVLFVGCPSGDDDDSAGDDDGVDPLAPVLSDLELQHASDGSDGCIVFVKWTVTDEDGDLAGKDEETGDWLAIEVKTKFDDGGCNWVYTIQRDPPVNEVDLDVDIPVGGVIGSCYVNADETYDVEVYLFDLAGRESNHLVELEWDSPTEDCL